MSEQEQVLSALPCGNLSPNEETVLEWCTLDTEGNIEVSYICVDGSRSGEYGEIIEIEKDANRLFWEEQ